MKLFQRLLVAPAALGLMAPMAANADIAPTEVPTEVIEARIDGVESQLGELMAGQFSSTTTLSGKAAFVTGYVDDSLQTNAAQGGDEITLNYMYQLDMNHSFTGDDLLYTRLKAGNFSKEVAKDANANPAVVGNYGRFVNKGNGDYLAAGKAGDGTLKVDKIWYQFPVGDSLQVWVGPAIENYYMLASAPSIYKPITKQFALGGNASTYGSSTSPGFGAAWTQQVDDPSDARFAISANYTGKGGSDATAGLLDEDSKEFFLTKVEYGSSQWQVSAAFASKTNGNAYDGYYHTSQGKDYSTDLTSIGLRAYWKPDETGVVPSVQIGYDMANVDNAASGDPDEMQAWMVGLGWNDLLIDGNKAGLAFGQRQHATSFKGGTKTNAYEEDNFVWEAYYTFKINDGVSVTPAIFGGEDLESDGHEVDGGVILTEFRF